LLQLLVSAGALSGLTAACGATSSAPATPADAVGLLSQPGATSTSLPPTAAAVTPSSASNPPPPAPSATAPGSTQPTPSATVSAPALTQRITAVLEGLQGHYYVVVAQPDGQRLYARNGRAAVAAASLYKLGVMLEAYQQRAAGTLDFAETLYLYPEFFIDDEGDGFVEGDSIPVADLLDHMITVSSNVAAAALLWRVGHAAINTSMRELGLTQTEIRWSPAVAALDEPGLEPDDGEPRNLTSAADMALLFQLLLAGQAVDADASAAMLALLKRQQINDRLPALLPIGAVVAHKTGNLPGVVHDAGVIYTPDGPLIVAALSDAVDEDEDEATTAIAEIGAAVYAWGGGAA
jgi:beta-lactamase class A